jgi:hypothetical protein
MPWARNANVAVSMSKEALMVRRSKFPPESDRLSGKSLNLNSSSDLQQIPGAGYRATAAKPRERSPCSRWPALKRTARTSPEPVAGRGPVPRVLAYVRPWPPKARMTCPISLPVRVFQLAPWHLVTLGIRDTKAMRHPGGLRDGVGARGRDHLSHQLVTCRTYTRSSRRWRVPLSSAPD